MKRTFTGNFKIQIEGLIKEKQALGFLYIDNQNILANFDRFCIENYPNETTLTRDIGMHWAELRPSEHIATLTNCSDTNSEDRQGFLRVNSVR